MDAPLDGTIFKVSNVKLQYHAFFALNKILWTFFAWHCRNLLLRNLIMNFNILTFVHLPPPKFFIRHTK